jgi:hypothetical protein
MITKLLLVLELSRAIMSSENISLHWIRTSRIVRSLLAKLCTQFDLSHNNLQQFSQIIYRQKSAVCYKMSVKNIWLQSYLVPHQTVFPASTQLHGWKRRIANKKTNKKTSQPKASVRKIRESHNTSFLEDFTIFVGYSNSKSSQFVRRNQLVKSWLN